MILKKVVGMDCIQLALDVVQGGFLEQSNEASLCLNGGNFLAQLNECDHLEKDMH
jgi:hypothetical protein